MVLTEDVGARASNIDRLDPVAERRQPGVQALAAGAQPVAEPVVDMVAGRRAVGPQVGADRMRPGLVDVPYSDSARVVVEPLKGELTLPRRADAHVALPGQWLDQRVGALVEDGTKMSVRRCAGHHGTKLGDGQRSVHERPPGPPRGRPASRPARARSAPAS